MAVGLSVAVCEIFSVKERRDLENRLRVVEVIENGTVQ